MGDDWGGEIKTATPWRSSCFIASVDDELPETIPLGAETLKPAFAGTRTYSPLPQAIALQTVVR